MIGKLTSAVFILGVVAFLIVSIAFFSLHITLQTKVNEIVYNAVETVSTSGILTKELYEYLYETINRYSQGKSENEKYHIILKLEKQIRPGIYDVFFETSGRFNEGKRELNNNDIIDRPLDIGDRITIYVEDKSSTIFGRLMKTSFMAYTPDNNVVNTGLSVQSMKTGVVSYRKRNIIKGYDVIAGINKENRFDHDVEKIVVITKLGGKKSYSDSLFYSINDPTDSDYIFPQGEFLEDIGHGINIYVDEGGNQQRQKIITYIQQ